MPAISACAATWPPNTRCRSVTGWRPRNRSTSRVSRSRSSTSSSADAGISCRPSVVGGVVGSVQTCQELLELLTDLLARRQRLVAGEQAAARLLGARERVVLLLQRRDDLVDLVVGREVAG